MRRMLCKVQAGTARPGTRVDLFSSSAGGSISLTSAVAAADSDQQEVSPMSGKHFAMLYPLGALKRFATVFDSPAFSRPLFQEPQHVVVDGGPVEYGVFTVGARLNDRKGNKNTSVTSRAVLVNGPPARIRSAVLSESAGRVTLTLTDSPEI